MTVMDCKFPAPFCFDRLDVEFEDIDSWSTEKAVAEQYAIAVDHARNLQSR